MLPKIQDKQQADHFFRKFPGRLIPDDAEFQTVTMNIKHIVYHLTGMAIAYGLVLLIPIICDFIFDTNIEMFVIGWFNIGLIVMIRKQISFPTPDMQRVDIKGGLKALWWAFFWPNYLLKK